MSDRGWIKKYDVESGKVLHEIEPSESMSLDALDYTAYGEQFVVGGT